MIEFVLELDEPTSLFKMCEYASDTIYIVSENRIFSNSLNHLICDKAIVNVLGTRSFNKSNGESSKNELNVYRIDKDKKSYKIYIMQPYTHYTIIYELKEKRKGKLVLTNYETGQF